MSLVHQGSSEFVRCVLCGPCILISARETIDVVKGEDVFVAWGYKLHLEMKMEAPCVLHIIVIMRNDHCDHYFPSEQILSFA